MPRLKIICLRKDNERAAADGGEKGGHGPGGTFVRESHIKVPKFLEIKIAPHGKDG